jgi:FKBP-type peptidyl-prolyl cis-trans isomerase FklB
MGKQVKKEKMKSTLIAILVAGLALQTVAQDKKAEEKPAVKTDKESISYAIGMNIGTSIKRQSIDVDIDTMAKAAKDVIAGTPTKFTEQEAQQIMMEMNNQLRAKRDEERKQLGDKNKKEGANFLAENAKKDGVKIHPVKLPDGQTADLQYKVITEGKGEKPKTTDTVTTQYRGRLIDGTEFDSSYKRGQPAEFPVSGVIKGWTEALQLMPVGSKWELYIPSELAYGERGSGANIGPNATLIFEIELISIKPKPAETNQAVSGEIIKVPSAEELKKGAKIEVIRPGQTNELKPK